MVEQPVPRLPCLKRATVIRIIACAAIFGGALLIYHKVPGSSGKAIAAIMGLFLAYQIVHHVFSPAKNNSTPISIPPQKTLLFESLLCKAYLVRDNAEYKGVVIFKKKPRHQFQ